MGLQQTRILTNIDEFYFNQPRQDTFATTDYLFLKQGMYCLLNSPPWIKWRSYSLWEEMKAAENAEAFYDINTDESFDIDYQIVSMLNHITEFLDLSFRESEISDFHCYQHISNEDIRRVQNRNTITAYTKPYWKIGSKLTSYFMCRKTNWC